jgi:hypothetical protein
MFVEGAMLGGDVRQDGAVPGKLVLNRAGDTGGMRGVQGGRRLSKRGADH